MGGMKVGGQHKWLYHTDKWNETKIAPRTWKFTYTQSKKRSRNAPRGSGMLKGSKLIWNIRAKQYAIKTGPNTYRLIMKGTKTQDAFKTPRHKWVKTKRRLRKTRRFY